MFDIGDKVVYPHHGAAVVERRETKEAFGKKQEYLVLRLAYGDLTLMVPADNTDGVGLREVINFISEVFEMVENLFVRQICVWLIVGVVSGLIWRVWTAGLRVLKEGFVEGKKSGVEGRHCEFVALVV